MTVKLSSLRVSAEMDVSQYVRAAAQKVAADSDMAGSAKAVGQALAATDAATSKAVPGVASLSRVWITGYGDAAKFESAVRSIGRALDRGMDPGRAAAQLDGVYRKFGQTADAASLARQGFVALAPVVTALNERYDVTAVIADRAAAATRRLTDAQEAQRRINTSFGIGASAGSAEESANAFLASVGGLEGVAAARGRAVAESFTAALNADAPKSAKQSAGAFTAFFDEIAVEIKRREGDIAAAAARIQTVQERLQQVNRIGYQFDNTPGARASMSAFIEADEAAVRSLTQAYDPLLTNEQRRNEALKTAQGLLARRSIDEKQYATVVTNINKVHDDTKKALEGAFAATGKYTSGVGLARYELINFGRQVQDIGVSLASGQSPLTVLIQQGTQIADVFASSRGSVGGFLREIGPTALRAVPAVAALGTALVAAYKAFDVSQQQQTLSNSLLGQGRASGLTGGALEELAKESAAAANLTVANARLIGAEFVKLGRIANDNLPRLSQIAKDYAAATGQTLPDAAKELRQALADPARGAELLGDKLGALDQEVVKAARNAGTYNERLAAMKRLMDEVGRATEDAADRSMSKWDRAVDRLLKKPLAAAGEGLAGYILGPSDDERLERINADIDQLRTALNSLPKNQPIFDPQIKALEASLAARERERAEVEKALEPARKLAEAREEEAKNADISARASAAAKPYQGLKDQLEDAAKAYKQLEEEQGRAEQRMLDAAEGAPSRQGEERYIERVTKLREVAEAAGNAKRYLDELRAAEAAGSVETYRAAEAQKIKSKYLNDNSHSARIAMAGELARAEMLATQTGETQRAAAAEKARSEALWEGTKVNAEVAVRAKYNVEALTAQTKAIEAQGVAAGETARLRKEAEDQARTKGGSAEAIFAQKLAERQAELNKEIATGNAELRERVAAQSGANAAAAAGNKSSSERANIERELAAREADRRKLIAAGITDQAQLNAKLAEGTKLRLAEANAAKQSQAQDLIYQQEQEYRSLLKQFEQIGRNVGRRNEELEVLRAQQQLQDLGISAEDKRGEKILENARRNGQIKDQLEQQLRVYNQIRQAQDFAADSLKSFLDELLTGTEGINGALKSLGKGYLSASLDALISGKGPLAGLTGLAATTRDGQGGLLGLLTSGIAGLGKDVQKGAEKGTATGTAAGIGSIAANDNFSLLGGLGINGKDLAGGLTAIAGLAGSYGSGMAAGSVAQAGIGGALSGGMAGLSLAGTSIGASLGGAAVLAPIGLIAGAGLAIFGQQQAQKQAKKEQRRQAYEAYREAVPQIAQLGSQMRGDPQGTIAQRFEEARASTKKLGDIAVVAGRPDEAVKLFSDLATFRTRVTDEFRASFGGMLTAFSDGTGPNSPFAAARDSVKSLGDQLKVFVDDTKTVYGDSAPEVERAREAVRAHALSVLDGAREMSVVATRMEEIRGAGAGLQQALTGLGMSADAAAVSINERTVAALARLKTSFEDDLGRRTNSALDKGYLNDAADLIKELATLRTDAAALGTDQGLVTDYFKAQAQSIVDGAELTGEAFADLIRRFPALNGYVSAFAEKIDAAAKAAEIAARRLGYQDRLFAALNDTTTLEGQLAAFDRTALREREAEIKAGGEAINDLETALAAERLKIIADFADQAAQEQKRALQEAQNFFDTFSRNLKQFVDNMRSGSDTPLSPEARLAAAQSQYNAQLALAQSGNRDAINGLTGYADALLDAGRAFYGSSAAFQSIFNQIEAQLTALPTQVSAEQFIVNAVNDSKAATVAALATMQTALANSFQTSAATGSAGAIASALSVYFNALDANTDNLLSSAEYFAGLGPLATSAEQTAARAIFNSIDADGDGQLSRLELIRASTQENVAKTDYTNALLAQSQAIEAQTQNIIAATRDLQGAANSILGTQSGMLSTQTALLDQIRALNDTSAGTLHALNGQFSLNARLNIAGTTLENNMVTALNKIVYNTAGTWSAVAKGIVPAAYAEGGWITGGVPNTDSVRLASGDLGMPGEFVIRKSVAQANASWLDAFNETGRLPGSDRDVAITPLTMMPAPANQNGGGSAAEIRMLREEVRALRSELERTTRAVVAGAQHVREGIDQGTAAQRESGRELKFRKRA